MVRTRVGREELHELQGWKMIGMVLQRLLQESKINLETNRLQNELSGYATRLVVGQVGREEIHEIQG